MLPRKRRKKRYGKRVRPLQVLNKKNMRWAMDFLNDRTLTGRNLRILTVIDTVTRECLALYADSSITGKKVADILSRLILLEGKPKEILSDNGPEFISNAMDRWAQGNKVNQIFIESGKPSQNGHCESFNGKLRLECLNQHWFKNLLEAQNILEDWRLEYNTVRPHMALGSLTPCEYALKLAVQD